MKITFAALIALTLLTTAAPSFARAEGDDFQLPLTRGHILADGSANYRRYGPDSWMLWLQPKIEYFIVDRLSIGGGIYGGWSDSGRNIAIAPSATFYFAELGPWAFSLNQTVSYSENSSSVWSDSSRGGSTALGASYFFNPHVAIKPEIRVNYAENSLGSAELGTSLSIYF